jgi:hypothetical protein
MTGPSTDDEATLIPLGDDELEAIAVKVSVARANPPGSLVPEPRPRKDVLAEAQDDVLRLLGDVRRHRKRERRWRDHLKTARAQDDAETLRRAVDEILDDVV